MTSQIRSPLIGVDRLWDSRVGGDLAFLLARANAISLTRVNTALAPFGLKVRSYTVLSLAAEGGRPSQRDLSEFLRLDPSQIVALVDQLESDGLVCREPDPADRRANVVVATEEGRERHHRARAAVRIAEQEVFAAFSAEDLGKLTTLLRPLANAPDID